MTKCINVGVPNDTVVHLLTTPKQVVDHMGGTVRLSLLTRGRRDMPFIRPNTIYGWLRRDSIPTKRLVQIAILATEQGRPFDIGAYVAA